VVNVERHLELLVMRCAVAINASGAN